MLSVSTAFKVHYNQKLGERTMASGGIDAPDFRSNWPRLSEIADFCSQRISRNI